MNVDTKVARKKRHDPALLAALAAGASHSEAAKRAGCSYRTVTRRMGDPVFRAELDLLKRQVVQQSAASISTASISATATLEALLASRDEWVRLKAAGKILDVALAFQEQAQIAERIAVLEERAREVAAQR
jgi:molybdenum-dependent DNA-binding transcriptional regulator ModE